MSLKRHHDTEVISRLARDSTPLEGVIGKLAFLNTQHPQKPNGSYIARLELIKMLSIKPYEAR